jgi:uncharacterized protein (TIGR03435 family)
MMRAVAILTLLAAALLAQTPGFEVASIRPTGPDERCGTIEPLPGGGLRVCGLALKTIVTWAYDVQDYQVVGGPSWTEKDSWDILAKPPADNAQAAPMEYEKMTGPQQAAYMRLIRSRLQSLLAVRFHLALRREMREQTAYALTIAKGGPKMREAAGGMIRRGRGEIVSRGANMESLVRRPVTNETGLAGNYEFALQWTPDNTPDASGPSIFTAIEEQLGLRLEARKAPVETLVIEKAERPEN